MMNIGDTFTIDEYDLAYAEILTHPNWAIREIETGKYELYDSTPAPLSIADQNENIRQKRESLYRATSDYLKADYDEAVARGSANVEELKTLWLESKDKIRKENPYLEDVSSPDINSILSK